MNPWPVEGFEPDEVHLPRPGHADLVGAQKYGHSDIRNVLERASARETAARVAAGTLARGFLTALGVEVHSHVIQIASVRAAERPDLTPADFAGVDEDPVRCLDPEASKAMVEEINRLRKANESLGGSFEVRVFGLVPGLGSHISWEDRLDGRLAGAVASIQSVKGVAIGEAWDVAGRPGSEAHDEIFWSEEHGYFRETNHAGGLEGGMTNGQPLSVRAAIKPISTLTKPLRSVDTETKQPAQALRERTDSTVVPAAAVVAEAMVGADPGRAATARSSAATTSTTSSPRSTPTSSASTSGAEPVSRPAIVFIGFMGAGKSTALAAARTAGLETTEIDELMEAELGKPIAEAFEQRRRGGLPRARGRGRRRAAGAGRRRRDRARRRQRPLRAGARGARPPHRRLAARSTPREAWRRIAGSDRPAGDQRRGRRAAAGRAPAALRGAGRRGGADGRPRRRSRAPCRRSRRWREMPAGTQAALGGERLRRVPGVRRPRACSESGLVAAGRAARFCVTDTRRRAALRRAPRAAGRPRVEVEPGEAAKTMAAGRATSLRELAARGDDPRRPRGRPRRRGRRRPRRLLRPPLPARRPGGAGADHARRPGRLRLRRQDRGRPARGQELRRRLPPAGGGDRRHRDAGDAAARRSSPPASSRC